VFINSMKTIFFRLGYVFKTVFVFESFQSILIVLAALSLTVFANLSADYIYLKDGSIIHGKLLKDGKDSISVRDKDNRVRIIKRSDVMRINFTEMVIGKVYVQKRDGTSLTAYLVEQDQINYIFRMDLLKADEISISRKDILFIAEKNPSGLKGTADADSISLSWFPPYDQVKEYRLYVKTGVNGKYSLAGTAYNKSFLLKKLKSNTTYSIIVTSIDMTGYESAPSNEIKITTKNISPEPPSDITVSENPSGGYNLVWNESSDADGKIIGYRIYRLTDGKESCISDQKKNAFHLPDYSNKDSIFIASYDDKGFESVRKRVLFPDMRVIEFDIMPAYIYPLGDFSKMVYPGYGLGLSLRLSNTPFLKSAAAVETAFYYMKGRKSESDARKCERLILVPVMLCFSIPYKLTGRLSIEPELAAGVIFSDIKYTGLNNISLIQEERERRAVDPVFRIGSIFLFNVNSRMSLHMKCSAGIIPSSGERMTFVSFQAGLRYLIW